MRITLQVAAVGAALCGLAAPAAASTVVATNCVSVADAHGCLFNGNINNNPNPSNANSYKNAEAAYNLFNNTHPSANPDITLTYLADTDVTPFPGTITGAGGSSGTWSLPGKLVNFIAVKASNQFVLYQLATPASSGSWSTLDIPYRNNPHDLSHLVFFGRPAVPEPATWAMMIGGFGLAGAALRRRRAAAALA